MQQTRSLFVASLKMLYRDQASLVFAVVSPVLLIAILGLFQNLRLDVGGASGAMEFYDFVVPGLAAFWIVYFSVYGMSAAATGPKGSSNGSPRLRRHPDSSSVPRSWPDW